MFKTVAVLHGLFITSFGLLAVESPKTGDKAPTSIVGTFVPGGWCKEQQSVCAVLKHRDDPKIAVFTRTLNDNVMRLTAAMDKVVAEDSSLKWSFLFVSHENSPTPNQEDWDAELVRLKQAFAEHQIEHIAAGLMLRLPDEQKVTRAKKQVGVFDAGDLVVMLIRPQQGTDAVIQEVSVFQSEKLTAMDIEKATRQMALAAAKE